MPSVPQITRPSNRLVWQYLAWSLATVIFFPFVFPPLLCKFLTLRYRFDDEGVSMSWGVLFRREISLTYARIQDIHVYRGVIERWLGIASLAIQTASGNAGAEMLIQGVEDYEAVRDFLYGKMRGHQDDEEAPQDRASQALELLEEIRRDMAAIRQAAAERPDSGAQAP